MILVAVMGFNVDSLKGRILLCGTWGWGRGGVGGHRRKQ